MWPAVPTITLFSAEGIRQKDEPSRRGRSIARKQSESGAFDFAEDGLCRRARVSGGDDRAADNEIVSACAHGFFWSCCTGLVVALAARTRFFRTNAGRDNEEIPAARFAYGARFLHGSNDPIRSGLACEPREFDDTVAAGTRKTYFA